MLDSAATDSFVGSLLLLLSLAINAVQAREEGEKGAQETIKRRRTSGDKTRKDFFFFCTCASIESFLI